MVKEFKREYREEAEELRQQKQEEEEKKFSQKLPRKFIAKLLYEWKWKRDEEERKKRDGTKIGVDGKIP